MSVVVLFWFYFFEDLSNFRSFRIPNRPRQSRAKFTICTTFGYANVDAFMQVYRATKKVKDSYERKLAAWNDKYGQYAESKTKPRMSIKESLKENEKKVEESKKKQKSRSRNSKNSERE